MLPEASIPYLCLLLLLSCLQGKRSQLGTAPSSLGKKVTSVRVLLRSGQESPSSVILVAMATVAHLYTLTYILEESVREQQEQVFSPRDGKPGAEVIP